LKKHALQVTIEKNPNKIPFLLNNDSYDVILLDMNFSKDTTSGKEGFYWLSQITEREPRRSSYSDHSLWRCGNGRERLKGRRDRFCAKTLAKRKAIGHHLSCHKTKKSYNEVDKLKKAKKQLQDDSNQPFKDILGDSAAIKKVFDIIDKVAQTDANVLILGENGTGKELVARALHQKSLRKDNVFIGVDMGAITETLFESELFGHKKGSFTDAKDDRAGRFEVANTGTLFLDEIGNLSLPLQSKLLTVLQNRQVTRIGANKPISNRYPACLCNEHANL
jgi:two-component system response regulator HydG